ncbi:hypothetical protein [Algoriphagus sp. Y33]|uniref:hypothetical protein n=1 Tax=Algoriphagus sp. Y33 TaxID=2772483 RepID=UPI001780D6FB|nr:hypothetical protein [Algoriphagus sp. Y33]
MKSAVIARLAEAKLRVNEGEIHIAYCKDYIRKGNHCTVFPVQFSTRSGKERIGQQVLSSERIPHLVLMLFDRYR